MKLPLVSIGIPTYNRATQFQKALASARAQTYDRIEVIISDNASTDQTREIAKCAAAADERIRFIRQEENIGASANFRTVLEKATGPLFMWLADDDWLDANYVGDCVGYLLENPDCVLVAGETVFHSADGNFERPGSSTFLNQDTPEERVTAFYREVVDCAVFYGVGRRDAFLRVDMPPVMGGDWHMLAGMATLGKFMTLPTSRIHRSLEGASKDQASLVAYYKLKGRDAINPFAVIVRGTVAQILWRSRGHRALSLFRRVKLSVRVYGLMYERFCMWDATQPDLLRRASLWVHRRALRVGRRASRVA